MLGLLTCLVLGALVFFQSGAGLSARERKFVQIGFFVHFASTFALVGYHAYVGTGDMIGYVYYGRQLSRLITSDVTYYGPEVLKLAVHIDNKLPEIASYDTSSAEALIGSTTTTMFALTGLVMTLTGPDFLLTSIVFGLFAFAGNAFFYKRLRFTLLEHERIPFLIGFMFVPSVTYWSSGIVKEAVLLGFMGLFCGALIDFLRVRRLIMLPIAVLGVVGMGLVKPYVIFPVALTAGAWLNARGTQKRQLAARVLTIVGAIIVLAALSRVFPEFSFNRIGGSVAAQQGAAVIGDEVGSNVEMGAGSTGSLAGQLRYIPLALVNSLARPIILESRNVSMLIASLEMMAVAYLVVTVIRRQGFRGIYRSIASRPPLVAAVVFTLSFGAAVGLTSTNLGTLSRYRIPMLPFYAAVLIVLRTQPLAAAAATAVVRKPRPPLHIPERR